MVIYSVSLNGYNLFLRYSLSQSGHKMDIYVLPVSKSIINLRALNGKTKFFIKPNGRCIVNKYPQLKPGQIQPVIGQDNGPTTIIRY